MQGDNHYSWQVDQAVLADAVALTAGAVLGPTAVAQFTNFTAINVIWLAGAYIFFCLGVFWLKRLAPQPAAGKLSLPPWLGQQTTLRLLAVAFALFITTLVALQLGYFDAIFQVDVRELGSGESSALLVFGPGAWLGGALFYMLILGSTAPPTITTGTGRARWLSLLGLLLVNLMLLQTAAALAPLVDSWLWLVPLLGLLLVLFAPPRLVYWTKRPFSLLSLLSFLLLLAAASVAIILL